MGDIGTALSGGQQQRVAIARAIYRAPSLLALDEGTSNLDVQTEDAVNRALKDLLITRISIAHRPDTLRKADRIIKVENARVIDLGFVENNSIEKMFTLDPENLRQVSGERGLLRILSQARS